MLRTAFALSLLGSACLTASPAEKAEVVPLEIGSPIPDFSLPATDGKTYSLSDFEDAKVLVVVFTSNHCPDSRAARDRVVDFANAYDDKGVQVIKISGNDPEALQMWEHGWAVYADTFEDMKAVAKLHSFPFPYLYDGETQDTTWAFGALSTPHTFIFDEERKLRYQGQFDDARRSYGEAETKTAQNAVDAILAGEEIEEPITRAFGCSTKWSWKVPAAKQAELDWDALPVTVASLSAEEAKAIGANKTEKLRLINLWSLTCGPCIAEFPDLSETYERFQRRPFEVITISIDPIADKSKVEKFLTKQHLPLAPSIKGSVEAEGRSTNNYIFAESDLDALAEAIDKDWKGPIPHTVLLAPGGEVLWRHTDQLDPVELRTQLVNAILKLNFP